MAFIHQEHRQPISAEDAKEVKTWHLPFWTDHPVWVSEKKDYENHLKPRKRKPQEEPKETAEEPVTIEETSIDAIEVPEALPLPTAEELENIRREAYNDGLEQGLIEGRQQGHKEGYDSGRKEGYEKAFIEGKTNGQEEGFREGNETGLRKAQADINLVVSRLERVFSNVQSRIIERDEQLPNVLASLVSGVCAKVLGYELSKGSLNILTYVQRALAELPEGEENIQVFIGKDDESYLQAALAETGLSMNYKVDPSLPAGSCRVESKHSLAEYSSQDYLNQMLESVLEQLIKNAVDFPTGPETNIWEIAEEHRKKEIIAKAEASIAENERLKSEQKRLQADQENMEAEEQVVQGQSEDALIKSDDHLQENTSAELLAVDNTNENSALMVEDTDVNAIEDTANTNVENSIAPNQELPHEPQ